MTTPLRPVALALVCLLTLAGCSERAAQSGAQGAATGAVSGAVGGLIGALVFGGDVGDAVSRGAVYGAAAGGTVGAIQGSAADQAEGDRRKAAEERLRADISDAAFAGLAALAECDHTTSIAQARKAQASENEDYKSAGLWLEVLSLADQRNEATARAKFPDLIAADAHVKNDSEAEARMREGLAKLGEIRAEYDLPTVCKT